MGRFHRKKPSISTSQPCFQLGIWVAIILWHDQFVDCTVLAALSIPGFRFAISPIFVESRSKTSKGGIEFGVSSQWFNEYWSDRKFSRGRRRSCLHCPIYLSIMSQYHQNPKTWLQPEFSPSCRNRKMEPQSDSNPAKNLWVFVWSGRQPRASYPFRVAWWMLTPTGASNSVPTRTVAV